MSGLIASSVGARWRACVCCESLQSYPADQRMFHNTWSTLRFDFSVNFQIHLLPINIFNIFFLLVYLFTLDCKYWYPKFYERVLSNLILGGWLITSITDTFQSILSKYSKGNFV